MRMTNKDAAQLQQRAEALGRATGWSDAIRAATKAVPDTWLDPLLTGPNAILPHTDSFTPKDVETLLHAVRKRVRDLITAQEEK